MMLHASVRNRTTKEYSVIHSDAYNTKEAFWRDLEPTYTVSRIASDMDLKAMEVGFETWYSLKKHDKQHHKEKGWWSQYHAYIFVEEARAKDVHGEEWRKFFNVSETD